MTENTQTLNTITPVKRGRGRPKGSTKVSQAVLPVNKAQVLETNKNVSKSKQEKLTELLRATGSKYNTFDAEEYKNRIEHMTMTDLQDECMKAGLKSNVTIETRNNFIGSLMELFYENKRSFMPDESGYNKTSLSEEKKARLTDLMKDAR